MAANLQKKSPKRTRSFQDKKNHKKSNSNAVLMGGVAVVVFGLLAFGMYQVLGLDRQQEVSASAIQVDSSTLASTSIDGDHDERTDIEAPVAAVDRETQYLGPASDPASLALAESGQVGTPTLVWFHADW